MSLADELLPSFYVIEIEGDAVEAVIPGEFDIERVSVGSRDFPNDMAATAALSHALQYIVMNPELDKSGATERVDWNPEFFPLVKSIQAEESDEPSEENDVEEEDFDEEEQEVPMGQVVLTRDFDTLGDFVETRWTLEAPAFKILGRVAVNPDRYMYQKTKELTDRSALPSLVKEVRLH